MADDTNDAANSTSGDDGNKTQAADKGEDTETSTKTQAQQARERETKEQQTQDKGTTTNNTNTASVRAALDQLEKQYGVKLYTEQEHNGHMGSARRGWASSETELKASLEKAQTELEKVTTERNELAGKIRFTNLVSAAVTAKAKYPDVVARLVPDDTKDDAETLKRAYADIRRDKPDLFRTESADGGTDSDVVSGLGMNDIIRQRARGG